MNTQQRAAIEQAIVSLEVMGHGDSYAAVGLREALAQPQDTDTIWWPIIEPKPKARPQGEPVYAFRRKGLDDFCTCDERRYLELSDKPNLFETTIFYTTPPSVEAAIEATKEKAAQLCWDRQQWGCAEAIRSMK